MDWLADGMAGTMTYMHRQAGRRLNPAKIVAGATRAIVVTGDYYHLDPRPHPPTEVGLVAKYARGADYHAVLRKPLDELAAYVCSLGGGGGGAGGGGGDDILARAFVDAGPVPERELAQRAGIGWIGKNTMLIDPQRGSYTFLATVLTNLDLAVDLPFEADRCGSCQRCLEACPTGAFPRERVLDSRLCISYLTIEHKGKIDEDVAARMGNWVFGCDVCQDVCPWNIKFAGNATERVIEYDESMAYLDLKRLMEIATEDFDREFGQTPLERPGAGGLRRNARIALANSRRAREWPMQ
jgi:epoxyqueuosine reductase